MERLVTFSVYGDGICLRRALVHSKAIIMVNKLLEEGVVTEPDGTVPESKAPAKKAEPKSTPAERKRRREAARKRRVAERIAQAAKEAKAASEEKPQLAAAKAIAHEVMSAPQPRTNSPLRSSYPIQKHKKAKGK